MFSGFRESWKQAPCSAPRADIHQGHRCHWSCLAARECTKSPPEVLSSPTFLSFYDKTPGSEPSAKQEIKEIPCVSDICSLFSVTSPMPLMAPPFQQTITPLDDSTLINPPFQGDMRSALINWGRGSRVSSPCLLCFDMLTATFQRASPQHSPEPGLLLNADLKHSSFLQSCSSS